MRLILMGSSGEQSLITLRTLLDLGIRPLALAMPQQPTAAAAGLGGINLVLERPQSALAALAQRHAIPLLDTSADRGFAAMTAIAPQLILVSCYPYRLPAAVLSLPSHGCFNLHPSMLPDYRGPSPIFWQLRDGLPSLGVSVHRMTPQLDLGPLLGQARLPPQPVQSYVSWVERLSVAGTGIFVRMLDRLRQGTAALTPQHGGGSYQSWPTPADFELDSRWPARRIAHFVAGTAALGRHFLRLADGRLFIVEALLDYRPGEHARQRFQLAADRLVLNCADGSLQLAGSCVDDASGWQGEER